MHTEIEVLNSCSKKLKVNLTAEELQPVETKVLKKYQKQSAKLNSTSQTYRQCRNEREKHCG